MACFLPYHFVTHHSVRKGVVRLISPRSLYKKEVMERALIDSPFLSRKERILTYLWLRKEKMKKLEPKWLAGLALVLVGLLGLGVHSSFTSEFANSVREASPELEVTAPPDQLVTEEAAPEAEKIETRPYPGKERFLEAQERYERMESLFIEGKVSKTELREALRELNEVAHSLRPEGPDASPGKPRNPMAQTFWGPEDFQGGLPSGWTIIDYLNDGNTWQHSTTMNCSRSNMTGGSGDFMIVDSDCDGSGVHMIEELITPSINMSGYSDVHLHFNSFYNYLSNDYADVDVSTDGGSTWNNVAHYTGDHSGPQNVDISAYDGMTIMIRFLYNDNNGWMWYWEIDDVELVEEVEIGCDGPYEEDFNVNNGMYVGTGSWQWGVPTYGPPGAYSPPYCWGTNLSGNYGNNACDRLTSIKLQAIADGPIMLYQHWYSIEGTWDAYNVEVSVDGGPWTVVATTPYYNHTYSYSACISGLSFSGNSGGWQEVTLPLNGSLGNPNLTTGQTVKVRWTLSSDFSITYPGLYIDDVCGNDLEPAPPSHDAELRYVNYLPEEVVPGGESIEIMAIVANIGEITGDIFDVVFYLDGTEAARIQTAPLDPGDIDIVSWNYAPTPEYAPHEVCVEVEVEDDPSPGNNGPICSDKVMATETCAKIQYWNGSHDNAYVFNSVAWGALDPVWAIKCPSAGPWGSVFSYGGVYLFYEDSPLWLIYGHWPDGGDIDDIKLGVWQSDDVGNPVEPAVGEVTVAHDGVPPAWVYYVATPGDLVLGNGPYYFGMVSLDPNPDGEGIIVGLPQTPGVNFWRVQDAWAPAGIAYDLALKACATPAPADPDLDIDDDYANVDRNNMELVGSRSKKNVISRTYGYFVLVNPKEDAAGHGNVDYWDGPGNCDFCRIDYVASDLENYEEQKSILAASISMLQCPQNPGNPLPGDPLAQGDARAVVVEIVIPDSVETEKAKNEMRVYRGTVEATGVCCDPIWFPGVDFPDSDQFTLKLVVTIGKPGKVLPNSFVGEWGDKGFILSWGAFDFAESFNLYRANEDGEFVKLNDAPLPGNTSYTDGNVVETGTYQYKFGIIADGQEVIFGPMTAVPIPRTPTLISLMPTAPNPMRTETTIKYTLPDNAEVSLKVYDVTGALVKTLVNESVEAGYHSLLWDGTNETGNEVANGVYFYRLTTGDFNQSRKLVVLR